MDQSVPPVPFDLTPLLALLTLLGLGVALAVLLRRQRRRLGWGVTRGLRAALLAEAGARRITDLAGRVVLETPEAARLWGERSVLGWLEGVMVRDEASLAAQRRLTDAARAGLAEAVDVAVLGLSGDAAKDHAWMHVAVRPLPGFPHLRLWIGRDVSAQRALDDVFRQEREDLADMLDFLPVGLYQADAEGVLRYANLTLLDWLRRPKEHVLGQPLDAFLAGEARPDPEALWSGALTLVDADGGMLDVQAAHAVFDDAGVTSTRGALFRETLAVQEREALRRVMEHRLDALFEQAPVGVLVADRANLIADANPAMAALLGTVRQDLLGQPVASIIAAEDRDEVARLLRDLERGRAARPRVLALAAPEPRDALIHGGVTGGEGPGGERFGTVTLHVIDASEQRKLEAQFAQAQKMQAMGQLAGGVSHDFNNLLTAITGYCDLLLQRHDASDPSFGDIMQIRQNANRAANLVRQLLAFSRRQPVKPRPLVVAEALSDLSQLLRRLLGETVQLDMAHGRAVGMIRMDPGQFDQVLINLAVNARDAMGGEGVLSIRTDTVTLTDSADEEEDLPPGPYVRITVADTGGGIPSHLLGQIFEPFFTTKEGGAGTGLGLSTVYGIVRQGGGTIQVHSVPGQGATFTLLLPMIEDTQPQEEEAAASPRSEPLPPALPGGNQERPVILFAEDEDAVRTFGARALRAKGFEVLEAVSGEGALERFEEAPRVDLLISDMVMPGMDGAGLIRVLRDRAPALPVILISGYSEDMAKGAFMDWPHVRFLQKPFNLAQLVEQVQRLMHETNTQ